MNLDYTSKLQNDFDWLIDWLIKFIDCTKMNKNSNEMLNKIMQTPEKRRQLVVATEAVYIWDWMTILMFVIFWRLTIYTTELLIYLYTHQN